MLCGWQAVTQKKENEPSRHVGFGDNNHVAPSVLDSSMISIA